MGRERYIFGNWKMNKTSQEAKEYFSIFCPLVQDIQTPVIGIAPPFTALHTCFQSLHSQESSVLLGAQNLHQEMAGAFTGEVSLPMLKEFGVQFVLIGHSERRHIFHEDDATIALKVSATARGGMIPVLCVGETLVDKEEGRTQEVLSNQLVLGLSQLPEISSIIIAYEPTWAIGTGKVASTTDVQEAHVFCRQVISRIFSKEKAETVSILYGGSVKEDNARGFAACPDVDGLLVGGASIDPKGFSRVIGQFLL
ncbi:Bifunctional PGK/TIM [Chlamydia avium]|uniref:Triosephosphate isomerase n=1 Tax=Chlamydia avium TaxID=1457141 RepID=A0ABN0MS74_9CHLA|nr:triose-phosphate isomerase [Chlamydia avium]EPP35944.1 triose-phosphate isomerase [Chlamydia psittaci 10_743_SC13]EPP38282.1 triose-phosphate isomerase [Chlamydia avium]VVT42614.1 Bifunctional PGK/TIM [Chlamydia avium]